MTRSPKPIPFSSGGDILGAEKARTPGNGGRVDLGMDRRTSSWVGLNDDTGALPHELLASHGSERCFALAKPAPVFSLMFY